MFDDTRHHLWIPERDDGFDWLRVNPVCTPWGVTRIVDRVEYNTGRIDPHHTEQDLCHTCVEILALIKSDSV